MPGPARAGAVIYASDMPRLAGFYEALLGMTRLHRGDDYTVLESPDIQLVIHAIPPHIASTFTVATPPVPREDTAIKLFFTVASISGAREHAQRLGGSVYVQQWAGTGFVACNGCDPEGNIFQLRESTG